MDKKIVLFNGPADIGKNTAIDYIQNNLMYPSKICECKDTLYNLVESFWMLSTREVEYYFTDRGEKEKPNKRLKVAFPVLTQLIETYPKLFFPSFNPLERVLVSDRDICVAEIDRLDAILTPREAMIHVSEFMIKPTLGQDWFGRKRVQALINHPHRVFFDSSTGFKEELPPLIDVLGQENILLLRIRRKGFDFSDSRGYIDDGVIDNTFDVENIEGEEDTYNTYCLNLVEEFICGKRMKKN